MLVHGFTADGGDWSFQTTELEKSYRVLNVDLRGHGRSSVPERGYELADYVEDVTEFLRAVAPGPVVALGHSIGGSMVVALAVEEPELVRAIVPIDASYGFPEEARPFIEQLAALGSAPDGAENVVQHFGADFIPKAPRPSSPHGTRVEYAGCPPTS